MPFAAPAQTQPKAPEAEICKTCHAEYVESYFATKHGQMGNVAGPTCTTCHGTALEHAKLGGGRGVGGIFGFDNKSVPADRKAAVCLSCHEGNRHLAFWSSGAHRKNDVACSDCHSLHTKPGPGATIALKKPNPTAAPYQTTERQLQYETCTTCHKQIRSQLLKPSHHPIVEGKLACTDCHNPHGALSKAMVNAESIPQLCTSCHAEKRGPFVWNHPPVEENCLICHNPHGANHARLLAEKPPNVCQDCHDASRHPGSIYDASGGWTGTQNTRLIARGCVNCHNQLHGSNAPAARGKLFFR
ncbi:MAG TPA: DmsE family decaheme c-type cytochrome [Burkholderiales bacterium]|nr:DmsE family decaheme c-type cytochrome [Burkholderiales bacterium]